MNEDFKSSACPEFEALLEDHLSGELGGPDAARLSAHLKSCTGCREALDFAAPATRLLSFREPTPDLGPGFARTVMARIREERERAGETSIWRPFVSLAWRFAAAAALAVVALVSYDATYHPAQKTDMAAFTMTPSRDLVTEPGTTPANRDEVLIMMAEGDHGKR
jgi:predicted anti-sigma-YlaC factor YlaD